MALIDRLAREEPEPANGYIANHAFSAALWFLSKGEVTRAQVVAGFGMSASDQTQLDQLITFFGTLSAADKAEFHSRLESAGILLESGFITKTKYRQLLGLT